MPLFSEEQSYAHHQELARIAEAALAWRDEGALNARACVALANLLEGKPYHDDPAVTMLHGPLGNATEEDREKLRQAIAFHWRHLEAASGGLHRCLEALETDIRASPFPLWDAKQALRVRRFITELQPHFLAAQRAKESG